MDIFVFDNVKAEKLKALLSYNRLQTLSNLFRLFEICLALLLLSYISARLPLLLRLSGDYLRRLIDVLLSPLFIFILSNLIVVTLLAKSGRLTSSDEPPAAFYEELIETAAAATAETDLTPANSNSPPEEIACEDKEIISETQIAKPEAGVEAGNCGITNPEAGEEARNCGEREGKVLRRSKSESVKAAEKPKLRRSETEMRREEAAESVEELSTEEFNRTVEEFIAKQMKFHLEEKVAIVSCS